MVGLKTRKQTGFLPGSFQRIDEGAQPKACRRQAPLTAARRVALFHRSVASILTAFGRSGFVSCMAVASSLQSSLSAPEPARPPVESSTSRATCDGVGSRPSSGSTTRTSPRTRWHARSKRWWPAFAPGSSASASSGSTTSTARCSWRGRCASSTPKSGSSWAATPRRTGGGSCTRSTASTTLSWVTASGRCWRSARVTPPRPTASPALRTAARGGCHWRTCKAPRTARTSTTRTSTTSS